MEVKFIAEIDFKRGDAVLNDAKYVINYLYFCKEELVAKRDDLIVYARVGGKKKELRTWFEEKYPLYEILKIGDLY